MAEDRFIVFASPGCIFCDKAMALLKEKNREHNIVEFEEAQQKVLNEIKHAHNWKTVPMIFCRMGDTIQFIGGYTDLVEYFEQEETR